MKWILGLRKQSGESRMHLSNCVPENLWKDNSKKNYVKVQGSISLPFYAHYKDIYDLSDAMEEEVVQSIANSIQHPEYLLEHPAEFARELLMAYISQNSLTAILFSGSQANHFADSIERSIKQMIFEKYPEFEEDTAMNVMLSFCIQGSYHAYQKNRSGDIMTVIDVIAGMTGAVRSMYEERLGESRS